MAGVVSTGWESKELATIEQEIKDSLLANVSPTLNLSSTSLLGQLVSAIASQIRQTWEAGAALYAARDPDQAEGAQLEELSRITGTNRQAATFSTVVETANLSATSYPHTFPAHTIVVTMAGNADVRFNNDADITISGPETAYEFAMTCETEGAISVNAGTLTQTTSTGVASPTNPLAAVPGEGQEPISELRVRRQESLAARGSTTVDAIRADLLAVTNVESVKVLANDTDTTDANGTPPWSIHALVLGGTNAAVAEALWTAKAATDGTFGDTSATVVDSQGQSHVVNFTRPDEVLVYIECDVTVLTGTYPSEEFATVGNALLHGQLEPGGDYVNGPFDHVGGLFEVGEDLIYNKLLAAVMNVPGVVDVTDLKVDIVNPPVGTSTLVAAIDKYFNINGGNITVNFTYVDAVP